MEKVDDEPQTIFDGVASGVADDQFTRRFLEVVGQKQCGLLAPQAGDGDLADRVLVAAQTYALVDIADLLVTSLGGVDNRLGPGRSGQALQAAQNGRTAPANRHKGNVALVNAGHFGVVDQLRVDA